MLNKEICMKCIANWEKENDEGYDEKMIKKDNELWSEGKVDCPYRPKEIQEWILTESEPHGNCPYMLEQVINA